MRTAVYADSITSPTWPTYTPRELDQYFKRIKLPSKYLQHPILKHKTVSNSSDTEALRVVTRLIRYQITNIPFENLELHYSVHHSTFLNPEHLFQKIIERKCGRGGHCMENTFLFVTVLRSLGYEVVATGARVNSALQPHDQPPTEPTFDGWDHMVAVVIIGEKKYLVDVGFGNNSVTFPAPLEDGYIGSNGRPATQLRISRDLVPDKAYQDSASRLMWVYSVRSTKNPDAPWIPGYCFDDTKEFLPQEFESISFTVTKNPRSWFVRHVVCLRFLMDKETEEIVGDVTLLDKDLKERRNSVSKVLAEIKTEKDRVDALNKHFGLRMSETERKGIKGLSSMITNGP